MIITPPNAVRHPGISPRKIIAIKIPYKGSKAVITPAVRVLICTRDLINNEWAKAVHTPPRSMSNTSSLVVGKEMSGLSHTIQGNRKNDAKRF